MPGAKVATWSLAALIVKKGLDAVPVVPIADDPIA